MNPVLEQVRSETAEFLVAQAKAQGLSVDEYLTMLLGMPRQKNTLASLSDEEFEALMEDFSDGTEDIPLLPSDFSRKDIYFDHD
ncbi:MAG: hypothetical protein ACRERD_35480 [Candidatus Binatia bacterium]